MATSANMVLRALRQSTMPSASSLLRRTLADAHRQSLTRTPQSISNPFSLSTIRFSSALRPRNTTLPPFGTQRYFGTAGGVPRHQLSSMEESANKNPGNANAQLAFYQLLLRANMAGILVERYQTGRFAMNPATAEVYQKALTALNAGAGAPVGSVQGNGLYGNPNPGLQQLIGTQTMTAAAGKTDGKGGSYDPVHVVVKESTGPFIFRWIKFILMFAVFTYLAMSAVTVIITMASSFSKGTVPKTDSEVRAEKQTTKFTDVHGCDEAKDELQEVVEFLRNPEKFSDLGAKLPKGVLLVGPPGTGKTLLARSVAGEAGVPFFYMSGSEFDEIFVGVGAKRVRELFTAAKSKAPAIVFIDELDAIGGKRNPRDQAHSKQTLNQLLTELDGFDQDTNIIIIGATNLPGLLDKALTRPGRFDRHINVDLPDVRGRAAILKHHAKKFKLAKDIEMEPYAARLGGRSGAELENLLNVAALRASRARATEITKKDLEYAYDRLTLGSDKRSMVVSQKEKEMTAYHEAGHALVQLFDKDSSSTLYKVTILPKGPSLGHTAYLPKIDKYSFTAAEYISSIRVALGGKMAEELQYGNDKVTSGVSSDLRHATDLSFSMVTSFGMSHALGPVEYQRRYDNLSSETRSLIETEVQNTLKKSYEEVRDLLTEKRKELDLLAEALVKYETLDRAEVVKVIRGESLPDRTTVPPGPMVLPIPADTEPEGLTAGIPHPQPPESPAPPAATS